MNEKRKIIEIYVTENKEEDCVTFDFNKCEDTKIANYTMKGLLMMLNDHKNKWGVEGDLEANTDKGTIKI